MGGGIDLLQPGRGKEGSRATRSCGGGVFVEEQPEEELDLPSLCAGREVEIVGFDLRQTLSQRKTIKVSSRTCCSSLALWFTLAPALLKGYDNACRNAAP